MSPAEINRLNSQNRYFRQNWKGFEISDSPSSYDPIVVYISLQSGNTLYPVLEIVRKSKLDLRPVVQMGGADPAGPPQGKRRFGAPPRRVGPP